MNQNMNSTNKLFIRTLIKLQNFLYLHIITLSVQQTQEDLRYL